MNTTPAAPLGEAFPYCRECLTYIDSDELYCDEHRPSLLTTCHDCGELSVSIDSEGFAPDYCDTCGGADRAN